MKRLLFLSALALAACGPPPPRVSPPQPLPKISPPTNHPYSFLPGACSGPNSYRCIVWESPSLNSYVIGPYAPELNGPFCDFDPSNGDVYVADYPSWTVQPKTLTNGKPNPGYPVRCP